MGKTCCNKLLMGIVLATAGFGVVVAMQPDEFAVTREARIEAPASALYAQVNDLHNWDAWSPWAKMDPDATNSFDGPDEGIGASMSWEGNSDVGEGRMTITDSVPNERVTLLLEFEEPITGTSTAQLAFTPEGDATRVTWSMHGHNSFLGKLMGLIMNCDKMVGEQFEQGLQNLGDMVKAGAQE